MSDTPFGLHVPVPDHPAELSVTESAPEARPEPVEAPQFSSIVPPQIRRLDMAIHASDGTPILHLTEDEDGILQVGGDLSRCSEAAGTFVRQVIEMSGRKITAADTPSSLAQWLNGQALGTVIQPAAITAMNAAWHAALEAGSCNCGQCPPRR